MKPFAKAVCTAAVLLAAPFARAELVDDTGEWMFEADGTNAVIKAWNGAGTTTRLDVPSKLLVSFDDEVSNFVVCAFAPSSIRAPNLQRIVFPDTVTNLAGGVFVQNSALQSVGFLGSKPNFEPFWFGDAESEQFSILVNIAKSGWESLLADGKYVDEFEYGGRVYRFEFPVRSLTYNEAYAVSANPAPGLYTNSFYVSLSSVQGEVPGCTMKIYYTLDGSTPSLLSQEYENQLRIKKETVVKCFVAYYDTNFGDLMLNGPVCSFEYLFPKLDGGPYKETVGGFEWTFRVKDSRSFIMRTSRETPAVDVETKGTLAIPNVLGGRNVAGIDLSAFERCRYITEVTFPATITNIASFAFKDCLRLKTLVWLGNRPAIDLAAFDGCPVTNSGVPVSEPIPVKIPSVIVPGGNGSVAVPESWLDEMAVLHGNEWKSTYISRFGSVFTNSLLRATGKTDAFGNELQVWQDYVAGTDPLNPSDVLTAWITITDGLPYVSWSPDLSTANPARVYKVYGIRSLGSDMFPTDVTALSPIARKMAGYKYFYVTVTLSN